MEIRDLEAPLRSACNAYKVDSDPRAWRNSNAYQTLIDAIGSISKLELFNNKHQGFVNSWGSVDHGYLAHWLINRAIKTDIETAIEDIDRYVTEEQFPVRQMLFLGSVRISDVCERIDLSDRISLVSMTDEYHQYIPGGSSPEYKEVTKEISAVLIQTHSHPRIHKDNGNHEPLMPELWNFDELEEIMYCIGLIGPCGPRMLANSISVDASIPISNCCIGQSPFPLEHRSHYRFVQADIQKLQDIYRRYNLLDKKTREGLKMPMKRLNLAMRRRWDVDTALDLGLALEILFSSNSPSGSSITFLLRLRASRLLRSTVNERKKLSDDINNLYKIRSSAAHSSQLPKTIGGMSASNFLKKGQAILADAITHFILHGEPDWDNVLYS